MKLDWRALALPLSLLAFNLVIGLGALLSGRLPDPAPSGWWQGEPVAFAPAWMVALRVPGFMLVAMLMMGVGLRWDPVLVADARKRQGAWGPILNLVLAVASLTNLKLLSMLANGQVNLRLSIWDCVALGVLFIGMGNFIAKSGSNGFWAFRTPWTSRSEKVYRETQRLAGWLLVAWGLLSIFGSPWLMRLSNELLGGLFVAFLVFDWLVAMGFSFWLDRQERARCAS
ncbi:SdpI family protein [bacterium]|nr:SdpI family protein [bacterium]